MKKIVSILLLSLVLVGCSIGNNDPTPEPPEVVKPTLNKIPFILRGVSFELPLPYQSLVENGWEANTDINYEIAPNTYVRNIFLRNSDNIIKVTFFNPTDETKMMSDVLIAEIEAENRTFANDVSVDIVVHDGITFKSTFEETEEQLGQSTEERDAVFADYTHQHTPLSKTIFRYYIDGRDNGEIRWIIISSFYQ